MNARPRPSDDLLAQAVRYVEPALAEALDRIGETRSSDGPDGAHAVPDRLLEAMRYAVLSPGKRLRPALALGAARAVGAKIADVLPAACAVEMVHAYSLVHDDLPALDDDDMRRGIPSCHKKFGEATALLAGDALLAEALAVLADERPLDGGARVPPSRRAAATLELARAIGAGGMVGGQHDDLALEDDVAHDHLVSIHRRKTGRLIQASVTLGAILGGAKKRQIDALRAFGADIGLAFQLVDDVLDADGVVKTTGATEARADATELSARAIERLGEFGRRARPLAKVAEKMAERVR